MPSFDAVIEPDLVELRNAVEQANKEIGTRFDFKGSSAQVDLNAGTAKQRDLTLWADSDFQLQQVRDLLLGRLAKRGVDARFIDFSGTPQKMSHDKLKLAVPVKSGIDADVARKLLNALKASKLKVQGQVQGDSLRIGGAKRDVLQQAIAVLRQEGAEWPLSFNNFRD
jgi:uncharacterized protein YajQ (UPF0234 family)